MLVGSAVGGSHAGRGTFSREKSRYTCNNANHIAVPSPQHGFFRPGAYGTTLAQSSQVALGCSGLTAGSASEGRPRVYAVCVARCGRDRVHTLVIGRPAISIGIDIGHSSVVGSGICVIIFVV